MAIDSKIIRIRRGTAADFNVGKTKLVQGEFAVVTDTKEAYFAAENGEAVRLATEKDVSQLEGQIGDLDVRSIVSIEKTSTEGLVDTYTIKFSDGTSQTYTVTNGDVSDAKIQQFITDWLDAHPDATTTVQDGAITYAKLADDVKEVIDKASKSGSGMTVSHYVGQLFDKSHFNGKQYIAWALGNAQYDKTDDTVNVLVNAADYHGSGSVTDLYLMKMNPHTLDYTLTSIVVDSVVTNQTNPDEVTFPTGFGGAYTYGFCIDSNGDYLFMPNYCNVSLLFRSSDHGASWKVTTCEMPNINDYAFTGLMQTSTGRLIVSTHSAYFWYSDNDGATWTMCTSPTVHTVGHEAEIVELKENTLIAVMRRKWNDTTNGEWSGTYIVAPAVVSYSYDNGTTWTNPIESQTIADMSSTGCAIAKLSNDKLELYATSRSIHGDANGVIYKHSATIDEALEDKWSSGKVVRYAKAIKGQDFGYPSCCVDSVGNTHLFYYDGDADASGSTNYYYIQSYQDINNVPINSDAYSFESPCVPYSAQKIMDIVRSVKTDLLKKINKLVIQGGGVPDDDGTTDYFVTDGLLEYFDFADESLYNDETAVYTGYKGSTMQLMANEWSSTTPPSDTTFVGYIKGYAQSTDFTLAAPEEFTVEMSIRQVIFTIYDIFRGLPKPSINIINGKTTITYVNSSGSNATLDLTHTIGSSEAWHHLALTISPTAWCYYVDGVLVASTTPPEDFAKIASGFCTGFLLGDMAYNYSVRWYDRALTADEIKQNFNYEKSLV